MEIHLFRAGVFGISYGLVGGWVLYDKFVPFVMMMKVVVIQGTGDNWSQLPTNLSLSISIDNGIREQIIEMSSH